MSFPAENLGGGVNWTGSGTKLESHLIKGWEEGLGAGGEKPEPTAALTFPVPRRY